MSLDKLVYVNLVYVILDHKLVYVILDQLVYANDIN